MRRALVIAALGAVLLAAPQRARASDAGAIVIEGHGAWTILGGKNPTGGFTPQASVTYLLALGDGARLGLGADIGVFGFGGATRWIGVLGGPTARLTLKGGSAPVAFSLTFAADFGRVPVCTPWEHPICPRFVGFFPSLALGAAYVSDGGIMLGGSFSARVVNTLIGTTASFEPALVFGFYFSGK